MIAAELGIATPGETEALEEVEVEAPSCPVCPGLGVALGGLGNRVHFRCRDCGAEFSHAV